MEKDESKYRARKGKSVISSHSPWFYILYNNNAPAILESVGKEKPILTCFETRWQIARAQESG